MKDIGQLVPNIEFEFYGMRCYNTDYQQTNFVASLLKHFNFEGVEFFF